MVRDSDGVFTTRIVDVVYSFPDTLLALALVAFMGPGVENATIAIAISLIPFYARVTYGLAAVERAKPCHAVTERTDARQDDPFRGIEIASVGGDNKFCLDYRFVRCPLQRLSCRTEISRAIVDYRDFHITPAGQGSPRTWSGDTGRRDASSKLRSM